MLQLQRPLAVIDAESTGLDPRTARIVRLTVLKVMPDGSRQMKSNLVNPGEAISPGATAVHGLTDDDVADAKPFRAYARSLAASLEDCDLAGFGIERFDLPLLEAEFRRAGVEFSLQGRAIVDAMAIFHKLEPRDLRAAYRRYTGAELPDVREHDTGARAALDVLEGEVAKHPELPHDPAALAVWLRGTAPAPVDPEGKFVWSEDGEALINFGRFRGHRLSGLHESQADYLAWVASNAEFSAEVRRIAGAATQGEFPKREQA
jgi:DNA polymerase-3 subunit epsilon